MGGGNMKILILKSTSKIWSCWLINPKDLDVMLKEKKSPTPGADGCSKHGSNAMSLGIW